MKTLAEIQTILRSHAQKLRNHFGIKNLAVFGSVVRGEAKQCNDVDIVADIPLSVNLVDLMGIGLYVCDILGMDVDLIPRGEIRSELRRRIL